VSSAISSTLKKTVDGLMSGSTTGGNNTPIGDVKISLVRDAGGPVVKKHKKTTAPPVPTPLPTPAGGMTMTMSFPTSLVPADMGEGISVYAQHSKRSFIGRRLRNQVAFSSGVIY
jgi:hypothetical protein